MYFKSDNRKIVIRNNTEEIIAKLFNHFFIKYQIGLKGSIRGSKLGFDYAD